MREFLRRRGPTAIAVTLAFLAGGGAVVTAQNLITSADIKDGAVKTADLANGAVNSNKIANQSVANADLANNAVGSAKISDGAVATADIANGSVNSNKVTNQSVANADLANNAVGSAKISDGSVSSADIANGGVANADLANNAVNSAKVANGSLTSADLAAGTIFSGPNWGVLDRNVIGNGDSYLRAGPSHAAVVVGDPPVAPPLGVGSLGLRTGADTDKAAFGNEVGFARQPLSELTAVSAFMYTTAENIAFAPNNLPSIAIEIDPNPAGGVLDDHFATMVFLPDAIAPVVWAERDGIDPADGQWGLSSVDAATPCFIGGTLCTFDEVMAAVETLAVDGEPALMGTVAITKGSDHPFSGAVDALQINDTV